MTDALVLDSQRLFPLEARSRALAGDLFKIAKPLPIISPHGHVDPSWFAHDEPFEDAVSVFLWPDHYVLRMLYSQGVTFAQLGIPGGDGPVEADRRKIWKVFAANYFLFRGTPSRLWLDQVFAEIFGIDRQLNERSSDYYFDFIAMALAKPSFRPRALFEQFGIEAIATTEGATDTLDHHIALRASGWPGRVITTFRPDDVVDPDRADFPGNIEKLGALTGETVTKWEGYLNALANRRAYFRTIGGATATDHGHPTARTADLSKSECEKLFGRILSGRKELGDAELFRAQMLTEMAGMSCDDGMTMQLHPGAWRNHNAWLFDRFGRDRGADIPMATGYVEQLKPLLDRFGNRADLTLILFTLDESVYGRELAPLAGHYPCLRLGPPWWFHDSPEGMTRFRRQVTETAGFYNTVGFNDDTRAFFSIPARHDVARRMDCAFLAELVATGRLGEAEAAELIVDLTYNLPKKAYRL